MKIFLKKLFNKPLTKEEQEQEMKRLTDKLEQVKEERRALAKEMSNG